MNNKEITSIVITIAWTVSDLDIGITVVVNYSLTSTAKIFTKQPFIFLHFTTQDIPNKLKPQVCKMQRYFKLLTDIGSAYLVNISKFRTDYQTEIW